jgi:hypothetical protein
VSATDAPSATGAPDLDAPTPARFGQATTADLACSVLANLDVPGATATVALPAARGYVVVVIDGLGWRQLHQYAAMATFLTDAPRRMLDAVHPSTTATNIASLGTGTAPGEHGMVGYSVALPDDDRPFNLLTWALGPHLSGEDVRDRVPPEDFQAIPTVWQRAATAGVDVTTVMPDDFVGTGLTRAVLRGGTVRIAEKLGPSLDVALAAVTGDGPALAYVHHGALDAAGHAHGPGSTQWRTELAAIDKTLATAAQRIPDDVAVLVTADHGMLRMTPGDLLDVVDEPVLQRGVRVVAGEARARQLHCHDGQVEAVAGRWQDRLGDGFRVLRRDDAIAEGWFGPQVLNHVRARIGDVLAWELSGDGGVINGDTDPRGGRIPGMHGSVTRDEVEVPMVTLHA